MHLTVSIFEPSHVLVILFLVGYGGYVEGLCLLLFFSDISFMYKISLLK